MLFAWKFHLSVMLTCPSEQLVVLLEALRFHTHPCRALLGDILVHALDFLDQPKGQMVGGDGRVGRHGTVQWAE